MEVGGKEKLAYLFVISRSAVQIRFSAPIISRGYSEIAVILYYVYWSMQWICNDSRGVRGVLGDEPTPILLPFVFF